MAEPEVVADTVAESFVEGYAPEFRWWGSIRHRVPERGTPPTIIAQPESQTVEFGASVTFTVEAVGMGSSRLHYRWLRNGWPIPAAHDSSYTIEEAGWRSAGTYTVIVSDNKGWTRSEPATLSVVAPGGTLTGPESQVVDNGTDVSFAVTGGADDLAYRWYFNGRWLRRATAATLEVPNAGTTAAGTYMVVVFGADQQPLAVFTAMLQIVTEARLVNLSTRGLVGRGPEILIVGFVIRGDDDKQILLRGVGPTLGTDFSVPNALADPVLTLYQRGEVVASNDNWGGTPELTQAFLDVGAFALPSDSADAALLAPLGAGAFTAHITAAPTVDPATTDDPSEHGSIALAELYDADPGSPGTELVNISARAFVGTEDEGLVAGFVIAGTTSETVLIRGVGPTLKRWGFRHALERTKITVYDADGNLVAENIVWDDDVDVTECNDHVGAFHFDRRSRDSALIATLPPGAYTVVVSGVDHTTGLALVEVYEVR
jgi:hypothetical protein